MGIVSFIDKVRRHFRYSVAELRSLGCITLIFSFILTFRWWGDSSFDWLSGVLNFLLGILVIALSLFVHTSAKKLLGLWFGHSVSHTLWSWPAHLKNVGGLVLGFLLCVATNGSIPLFLSSSFSVEPVREQRVGLRRGGVDLDILAYISVAGLAASALLAGLGVLFNNVVPHVAWSFLVLFNALYVVYNVLPLPKLDGSNIFFASRLIYVFILSALIIYLVLAFAGMPSIIIALAAGLIALILFYWFYERTL